MSFEVATFALIVAMASLGCIGQCYDISKNGFYHDPKKEILDRIEKLEHRVLSEIKKTNISTTQYVNTVIPPF